MMMGNDEGVDGRYGATMDDRRPTTNDRKNEN